MWTDVAKRLVADGQSDGKVNGALLVVNYLLRGGSVREPLQSDRSTFFSQSAPRVNSCFAGKELSMCKKWAHEGGNKCRRKQLDEGGNCSSF